MLANVAFKSNGKHEAVPLSSLRRPESVGLWHTLFHQELVRDVYQRKLREGRLQGTSRVYAETELDFGLMQVASYICTYICNCFLTVWLCVVCIFACILSDCVCIVYLLSRSLSPSDTFHA